MSTVKVNHNFLRTGWQALVDNACIYIYIYIYVYVRYTHTHTHTCTRKTPGKISKKNKRQSRAGLPL